MVPRIVVVEDNEDDERLTLLAIRQTGLKLDVCVARTGEQACAELLDGVTPPALVLLDLDLPDMSGLDILKRMRANRETRFVPVVIFSSTSDDSKIFRCMELSANSFIQKPVNPELYGSQLKVMVYYWLAVNYAVANSTCSGFGAGGVSDCSDRAFAP